MAQSPRSIKLPRGRHGLSRDEVRQHQRIRMLEAIARTVGEKGYADTSVQDVVERAAVSSKTFYQHFADKRDCFLQAYDAVVRRVMTATDRAYAKPGRWSDRVCRGFQVFLGFFASEPGLARMAMVEVLAAGQEAIEHYQTAVRAFIPYLEEGRRQSRYRDQLPENISEMTARGAAAIISAGVAAGHAQDVPALLPELVYFILVPFTGPGEAAKAANKAREEQTQLHGQGDESRPTRASRS
jgi:AcrR family transcriptional regulator